MQPVMNPKTGQPTMYIPFPASWKSIDGASLGKPMMSGPNGLILTVYEAQSYSYFNDWQTNQTFQSNGVQVMAPAGIENVISRLIIPQGRQMGMTFVNQYPLPKVAECDAQYARQLMGVNSNQNQNLAAGIEWTDGEGNHVLVVVHYHEFGSQSSVFWGYNVEMLKVKASGFDKAKNQYLYALSNKVYNQNEINKFNSELAGKLKADNDQFQATQKIITQGSAQRLENDRKTSEYIRDLNQAGYEHRAHENEMLQEQMGNWASDENTVISPFDGNEYQVESGSKIYWFNNEGKYITSDDVLYDPNKYEDHPDVWQKAPQKEYK